MKNVSFLSLFFLAILMASCSDDPTGSRVQEDQPGMIVPSKNDGIASNSKTILFKNGMIAITSSNILDQAKTGEVFLFTFKEFGNEHGRMEIELLNAAKADDAEFSFAGVTALPNWQYEGLYEGDLMGESYDSLGNSDVFTGQAFLALGEHHYEYRVNRTGDTQYEGDGAVEMLNNIGFYAKFGLYHSPNPPTSDVIILNGEYIGGLYENETYGTFLYLHKKLENNGFINYFLTRAPL